MAIKIINLEAGMPSVETARIRLLGELQTARVSGNKTLKIIHGYGSSGKGGAIKAEVGRILLQKKREGAIRDFVKGEDFTPFSPHGRRVVALDASLGRDRDYTRGNDGITIVVI